MKATKDYDPGADTSQSEHSVEENQIPDNEEDLTYITERFTSSSRYETKDDSSAKYIDSDEDW